MRRITSLMMFLLLGVVCWAIPADKTPIKVTQSDGSVLTLRLVGDEFFHYNTTADGYTVLRNANGSYEYAVKQGNVLVSSGMLAHDATLRTQAEKQLLSQVGTHLRASSDVQRAKQSRASAQLPSRGEPTVDYDKFRGLIILINYTDRQFSMEKPYDFYNNMANEENYTGFTFNGSFQSCTGSMHDYFTDQSGGIFRPQFDVVGPVDVNFASTDHNSFDNSWRIFKAAVDAADSMVDFAKYDCDGDGMVDMVYFLVAGYSANYGGNNSGYLWPHKSVLYDHDSWSWIVRDGKYLYTYACSTEIYGWEAYGHTMPLGIATMAHEFSHVLGLPDLYDTDYDENGQSHDPGGWDVMAGGDYNYGRTPVAYSAWERYALGWSQPREIKSSGSYSLQNVGTTGDGLILRTLVDGEFFMLDNRQNVKWDAYLPGHGMLIARVDSTDVSVWDSNDVNCYPSHNYYELLRAGNSTSGTSASDPFPGTSNVTRVGNQTQPNLLTWAGVESLFELENIRENEGVVSFDVYALGQLESLVEDFEQMAATTEMNLKNVQGNFAKWNFTTANVTAPGSSLCNGAHSVAMVKPSILAMAEPLRVKALRMEFKAFNSSSTEAKFTIYQSADGSSWTKLNTEYLTVSGNATATLSLQLDMTASTYYRITMAGGSTSQPCYVDDVTFYYTDVFPSLVGDVNGDGTVDVSDVNAVINMILGKDTLDSIADLNNDGQVDVTDVNIIINIILGKA
ncbi:MAG: M6 family metalloprotease domain-containing protein [Muribaculaceae bacterium]|nr:M6 family metalloprotease domain-containing protein [Muribaculaceae bacterium]